MTDKLDIVYGMCVHGGNMAMCSQCNGLESYQIEISSEIKDKLNDLFKKIGKSRPKKDNKLKE